MISINNIYKAFPGNEVLKDISATFEDGHTSLVIGASGSGKTVLIKSMIGLFEIDSGSIQYDGRDFINIDAKERKQICKELGMLFQGMALFDSMTVEQNVIFPLNMFSDQTPKEKRDRVNFCLDRVNLHKVNHMYPAELSGGMQKRVGIARAIVLNPKYLFCDEPNSGLDPQTAIVIDKLIKEITYEYKMTTVINTHDMNSVMEIGDNIIFLYEGKKHWEGSNTDIMNSDNQELTDFIFASEFLKELKDKGGEGDNNG